MVPGARPSRNLLYDTRKINKIGRPTVAILATNLRGDHDKKWILLRVDQAAGRVQRVHVAVGGDDAAVVLGRREHLVPRSSHSVCCASANSLHAIRKKMPAVTVALKASGSAMRAQIRQGDALATILGEFKSCVAGLQSWALGHGATGEEPLPPG
jgi:hypothetical protein